MNTMTLTPDAHMFKSTFESHKLLQESDLVRQLLSFEFVIRNLGFKPIQFSSSCLSAIFSLATTNGLSFDMNKLEIGLFVIKESNSISLWPVLPVKSLQRVLSHALSTDVHLTSYLAKVASPIQNGVPAEVTDDFNSSTGATCQLDSDLINTSTSISKEEIQLFHSAMIAVSLPLESLSTALAAKRLIKLLPSHGGLIVDLQYTLDSGFIKAHRSHSLADKK